MEDNDDDYFSDDFDSLPAGTLYELEQNAFQATQAPTTQHGNNQLVDEVVSYAQPGHSAQQTATLKPPPRLHTGLTNEYDTLEVGELEAEIHDNGTHDVLIPENMWPVNGGMGDAMEVDDYSQGNAYEWNQRMEQVGPNTA